MTENQKAAFVNSQTAAMLSHLEAMKAANQMRIHIGERIVYNEDAFLALPAAYGLEHNQVMILFQS